MIVPRHRLYAHNDKDGFIDFDARDIGYVGGDLLGVFVALQKDNLQERIRFCEKQGGRSSSYSVHRRLFSFQGNPYWPEDRTADERIVQVYEVVLDSHLHGQSQYLSILLAGVHGCCDELFRLGFSSNYKKLAKEDPVPAVTSFDNLWLDNFIQMPSLSLPKAFNRI